MENRLELLNKIKDSLDNLKKVKGPINFSYVVDFDNLLRVLLADPEFAADKVQLENYLQELSIYRFRYLDTDDFYNFFSSGVEKLFRQGIDADFIIDGIRYFNYQNWDLESYRISREKILGDLYKNKELLTKEKIVYENGKEEEGSVKNWFKHYQTYFAHDKDLRLSLLEYMDKNKSVIRLTIDEKAVLRNLIYVIEYLRAPAEDVLAGEESMFVKLNDGSYSYVENGQVQIINIDADERKKYQVLSDLWAKTLETSVESSSDKIADASVVLQTSVSTPDIRQIIQLSESDLLQLKFVTQKYKSLGNEEVINYFWEGLEAYNLDMVLGAVQELIVRQQWDDFIALPRLRLLIKDFNSRKQVVPNVDEPRARLRLLFEWLLEEQLGLTDEKTKKWALYFSNLLLKYNYAQYKNLLIFDKQTQKLKWFVN